MATPYLHPSKAPRPTRSEIEAHLPEVPRLVRACHARMGYPLSPEDLDDAIQEASLTSWRRMDGFRGDSAIDSWLYGIARLCILKQLTARRRATGLERGIDAAADECEEGPGPATQADTAIHRLVDSSLQRQGTTVGAIFRRKNVDSMSFVEIAEEMHMPTATVKTRYYRSLPKIKHMLNRVWRDLSA